MRAILIALVSNTVRMFTTILFDYAGAERVAAGMGHELYGVFALAVMMAVYLLPAAARRRNSFPVTAFRGLPIAGRYTDSLEMAHGVCTTAAMLLVAGDPIAVELPWRAHSLEARCRQAPVVSAPWQAVDDILSMWSPRFVNPRCRVPTDLSRPRRLREAVHPHSRTRLSRAAT